MRVLTELSVEEVELVARGGHLGLGAGGTV